MSTFVSHQVNFKNMEQIIKQFRMAQEQLMPSYEDRSSDTHDPGRILMIAPQPFYQDRGTPIAVKHVITALSLTGHKVDLLTYPIGESIALPGLQIFRIGKIPGIQQVPIGFSVRKLLLDICLFNSMRRQLRLQKYDCIHAVEELALMAVILGRKNNIPVIYDMQSSLPEQLSKHLFFRNNAIQKFLRYFERWLIRNADYIVCSVGLEELVLSIDPTARVQEWYFPGQDIKPTIEELQALRKQLVITPPSRVVLYTGNFEPYQGVTRLIDAASMVISKLPETVFVLVGIESEFNRTIAGNVNELVRRGALKIVPRQPKSKISQYLAMADVAVSPREHGSNLPLKIFDYMTAGLPIVATDIPAHRKVLDHTRAELVELSAESMATGIERLLRNPELATRLGSAAKAYAIENLGWSRFAEQVVQLQALVQGQQDSDPKRGNFYHVG